MTDSDTFSNFSQMLQEFATKYCIINGAVLQLDEVQQMGFDDFTFRTKVNMPSKLYKYYPNKPNDNGENYSLQALKNNTVFMQSPIEFDDVYDSDINLDFVTYEKRRLLIYSQRLGLQVTENNTTEEIGLALIKAMGAYFKEKETLDEVFCTTGLSKTEILSFKLFEKSVHVELLKTKDWGISIVNAIADEYKNYITNLKTKFRISCFTTTPYSQLMWGAAYADYHKGFCLEYTILPNDENYKDVYYNLFPMIYCKVRPDMADRMATVQHTQLTKDVLWDIYFHGALRKSIDWAFQNEWRLLLPMNNDSTDFNMKFFPITKVFLGNRMPNENRKEIIDICHDKNIPYIGVTKNPTIFEMEECKIKCEDCFHYKKNNAMG